MGEITIGLPALRLAARNRDSSHRDASGLSPTPPSQLILTLPPLMRFTPLACVST